MYDERLEETGHSIVSTYRLAFDTTWTVAQVLNYTEEMRLQNQSKNATEFDGCSHLPGELVPLNEFEYSNAFMGCVMRSNYYKVDFTGVSVSLEYVHVSKCSCTCKIHQTTLRVNSY